jgi:Pyruvate/2-oxoacid:ferredoxin oxidoreductase delta subunit
MRRTVVLGNCRATDCFKRRIGDFAKYLLALCRHFLESAPYEVLNTADPSWLMISEILYPWLYRVFRWHNGLAMNIEMAVEQTTCYRHRFIILKHTSTAHARCAAVQCSMLTKCFCPPDNIQPVSSRKRSSSLCQGCVMCVRFFLAHPVSTI